MKGEHLDGPSQRRGTLVDVSRINTNFKAVVGKSIGVNFSDLEANVDFSTT